MNANFYKIEAITNMHVGSGDANYGVIDNLVQRDPVTTLPKINGSSLKGALKEFFEHQWEGKPEMKDKVKAIFGCNDNNADYRFLGAKLLAIPVRSNKQAYFLATAPMVFKQLEEDNNNFGLKLKTPNLSGLCPVKGKPIVFTSKDGLLIEDFESFKQAEKIPEADTIFGDFKNIVYFNDEDFKELCGDTNLPVVARNRMDKNRNLWYEQIVPHKSLFYFVVLHNNQNIEEFDSEFIDKLVHIGANATVGYGFTKISKL